MNHRLPNLFVIGAPKCGTTSLHAYLAEHPEVAMTSDKEPGIFAREDYRDRLGGYSELFTDDAEVRGESSVIYSEHPCYSGVPGRIHSVAPDARFVYVVGDPVDRTVRHYVQLVADGKEGRPIEEALSDLEGPYNRLSCSSRYAKQVRQYLECFDASRILVVDQQDLLERRTQTLSRVFEFLGVDAGFESPVFEALHNTNMDRRRPKPLTRLAGAPRLRRLGRLLPAGVRARGQGLLYTPVERPSLDPGLRSRLEDLLRGEVDWLRSFSGQSFPGWSL